MCCTNVEDVFLLRSLHVNNKLMQLVEESNHSNSTFRAAKNDRAHLHSSKNDSRF